MRMTINDIYHSCGSNEKMLGNIRFTADWWNDYVANYAMLDNFFRRRYGKRVVIADNVNDFRADAESALYANKYMLDTRYKTLSLQYNPIYNVEEHTQETINNDNSILNDTENGRKQSSVKTDFGNTRTNSDTTIGETKQNTKNGSHIDQINESTVENVAPFNNDAMHPKAWVDKNTSANYGDQIVSIDNSPRHDVSTLESASHTDNTYLTEEANTVNITRTEDLKQVLQRDREGNIGVTSTQNMIEQERQVALYNFWVDFFKIVVKECCIWVISDFDGLDDREDLF